MTIKSGVVQVTPKLAEQYLETNTINRPVSERMVDRYAEAMKRGEWRLTHQGIAFDEQGRLQDGQHRLWAILRSNCTIALMVTHGLSDDAIKSIDTQKPRKPGDALGIMVKLGEVELGDVGDPKRVAEVCNSILQLIHRYPLKATTEQILEVLEMCRAGLGVALREIPNKHGLGSAPVRAAVAFAHKTEPAKVEEFARSLASGANLQEGHPALVLREVAMGVGRSSGDRRALAVRSLNAIGYALKGELVHRLYATEDAVAFFGLAHKLNLKGSTADGVGNYARRKHSKGKLSAVAGGVK